MPDPTPLPKYGLHKARGLGVVRLNGRDFYLGAYGTPESLERYNRLVNEWLANGRRLIDRSEQITIIEVMAAFVEHAREYYRRPDGTPTTEFDNYCQAFRPLKKLYGTMPAAEFGPKALRAVQQEMIGLGWCRSNINKQVNRIRSFFKWAGAQELVPATVYQGLQCVPPLKRGRCSAAEAPPVRPVPLEHIEAVKPFVSRQVWALIQLQLLTGARAGELVTMRAVDLDTSGATWTYTPSQHKTAHHGHARLIHLGPRAQTVVRPFLAGRAVDAFLFSPADAEAERRAVLTARRVTHASRGNVVGSNRVDLPARSPRQRYDVASYRRAIARACRRAHAEAGHQNPDIPAALAFPIWHPHQLRHNVATDLRREFGVEVARVVLGHKSASITEIYAEQDHRKAVNAITQFG